MIEWNPLRFRRRYFPESPDHHLEVLIAKDPVVGGFETPSCSHLGLKPKVC